MFSVIVCVLCTLTARPLSMRTLFLPRVHAVHVCVCVCMCMLHTCPCCCDTTGIRTDGCYRLYRHSNTHMDALMGARRLHKCLLASISYAHAHPVNPTCITSNACIRSRVHKRQVTDGHGAHYIRPRIHMYMHTYITHIHIHTCMHTYIIHTYVHTHT